VFGIRIELKRQAPGGGGVDDQIQRFTAEQKRSRFKFVATEWPVSLVGTHIYGDITDSWGLELTKADVEKREFGVAISVKKAAGASSPLAQV